MVQQFPTQAISKQSNSTSYPIYATRGGFITNDQPTTSGEMFIQLMVGTSGSVIVKNKDGQLRYYPLLLSGALYPIVGVEIVTSATVDGQSVATTAADIWWYGGE